MERTVLGIVVEQGELNLDVRVNVKSVFSRKNLTPVAYANEIVSKPGTLQKLEKGDGAVILLDGYRGVPWVTTDVDDITEDVNNIVFTTANSIYTLEKIK